MSHSLYIGAFWIDTDDPQATNEELTAALRETPAFLAAGCIVSFHESKVDQPLRGMLRTLDMAEVANVQFGYELHGFEGQPFLGFNEATYYLEGATVPTRDGAIALLKKATDWEDPPEPEPTFMYLTSDAGEIEDVGGEGEEAWLECGPTMKGAVPFWKAEL
jgi:hypothetical protein